MGRSLSIALGSSTLWLSTACGGSTTIDGPTSTASYGGVSVGKTISSMGANWLATARFYRVTSETNSQCATLASENDCNLIRCTNESATAASPGLDAGRVLIDADQRIEMRRGADGAYGASRIPGPVWSAGEVISIHVQGNEGDPPPFRAQLTAPELPILTGPSDSTVVDVTQDLAFAWTGATSGYVLAFTLKRNDQDAYVSCRWIAADGGRAVPSSLLSGLAPGPTTFFVRIEAPRAGALSGDWAFSANAFMEMGLIALTLQ